MSEISDAWAKADSMFDRHLERPSNNPHPPASGSIRLGSSGCCCTPRVRCGSSAKAQPLRAYTRPMSSPVDIPAFVRDDLAALQIDVPEQELQQLGVFLDRLLDANTRMNLTAIRERDTAWRRLIIDSLTLLPGLVDVAEGAAVLDVGTGGGLPGVPLAISRPDLKVTLLDATGKKVQFLDEVIRELGLSNCRAFKGRAETLAHNSLHRAAYDVVICRAMGHLSVVLECCLPFVKVGGRVLAMKGPRLEEEMQEAGDALALLGGGEVTVFDAYPRSFANDLVIASIEKDRPTPREYPRLPGVPKKEPL